MSFYFPKTHPLSDLKMVHPYKNMYEAYGPTRFVSLMTFGLVMLALPIKMYLRWIFNLQYIIAIPEWFFNI